MAAPRCSLVLAGVLAASLLIASPAVAKVPKFKPRTIVTGKSIGGVKLGMTKRQAVAVWGKPDSCRSEGTGTKQCMHVAPSTLQGGFVTPPQQYAGYYLRAKKVIQVYLETAENTAVDPKLNRLKTSKGIKLHSTMDRARSAYNLPPPSGGEAGRSRALYRQKRNCTMFYAPQSPYTEIEAITVGRCSSNVGLLIGAQ